MSQAADFEPLALELAARAADVTLPAFRRPGAVQDKGLEAMAYDPVTAADQGAEAVIREHLARACPDHGVIGEEYGEDSPGADWVWILDPIDGTRAFISGLPLWTTLIALLHEGRPVLGLIAQPYLGEVFVGTTAGSRLIRPGQPDQRLSTRACPDLASATLSTTDPALFLGAEADAWSTLQTRTRLRRLGCDAYAYAMVAAGHIDLVLESGLKLWDWAAHAPLIEGAGGVVTGWDGGPPSDGRVLACGDRRIHAEALEIIAAA